MLLNSTCKWYLSFDGFTASLASIPPQIIHVYENLQNKIHNIWNTIKDSVPTIKKKKEKENWSIVRRNSIRTDTNVSISRQGHSKNCNYNP